MSDIDSSRAKRLGTLGWLVFAGVNVVLTFALPGEETIPYHLVWASFALMYGIWRWSALVTWSTFSLITVITGVALLGHVVNGVIGWEEASEIVLMGLILALLIWHVNRQWRARDRLVEMQEQQRREFEQRELAASFGSHEVRTRLTIARGHAELIADTTGDAQTRADAEVVITELGRATQLTENLLHFVRFMQPAAPSSCDVDVLVRAVVSRWSSMVERNWICTSAAGRQPIDSERLEAVLNCLLDNATRFTGPADTIEVMSWTDGLRFELSVRDTGEGIAEKDLARVFDLFHTSPSADGRGGSGLGLPIVRAISQAWGGSTTLTSARGQGTRVVVGGPARRRDQPPAGPSRPAPAGWPVPAREESPTATASV